MFLLIIAPFWLCWWCWTWSPGGIVSTQSSLATFWRAGWFWTFHVLAFQLDFFSPDFKVSCNVGLCILVGSVAFKVRFLFLPWGLPALLPFVCKWPKFLRFFGWQAQFSVTKAILSDFILSSSASLLIIWPKARPEISSKLKIIVGLFHCIKSKKYNYIISLRYSISSSVRMSRQQRFITFQAIDFGKIAMLNGFQIVSTSTNLLRVVSLDEGGLFHHW